MIETLVAYIADRGFEVDVLPGRLIITKRSGENIWNVCWAISQIERAQLPEEAIFAEADRKLRQLSDATGKSYDVIVDEKCQAHGGQNFAYQYHDENFVRIESVCEGCTHLRRFRPAA